MRGQVQDLEEQNLELHQLVQQLQDELKRINMERSLNAEDSGLDDSAHANELLSFGSEVNGGIIPENLRLKNEIKRMQTLNTAMLEQQNQHRCAVSDLERELNRVKNENNRLNQQLLDEKTHSLAEFEKMCPYGVVVFVYFWTPFGLPGSNPFGSELFSIFVFRIFKNSTLFSKSAL